MGEGPPAKAVTGRQPTAPLPPPQGVYALWETVASSFCGAEMWNVVGVDLMQEAYALSWAEWHMAATTIGDRVLQKCPRWLIFVQGVGEKPGTPYAQVSGRLGVGLACGLG